MKHQAGSQPWMAGRHERRVAIGVAVLATLVASVLILMPREQHPEPPPSSFPLPEKPKATHPAPSAEKRKPVASTGAAVATNRATGKTAAVPARTGQGANGKGTTTSGKSRRAPSQTPTSARAPTIPHGYYVQVGAFRDARRATRLARQMAKSGRAVHIKDKREGLHAVLVGPWHSRVEAERKKADMSRKGIKGFIVHY